MVGWLAVGRKDEIGDEKVPGADLGFRVTQVLDERIFPVRVGLGKGFAFKVLCDRKLILSELRRPVFLGWLWWFFASGETRSHAGLRI